MDDMLLIAIPFSIFVFILWVGGFVYMFLNIMRNDPREIQFRTDSDETLDILPKKII
jgi:hypothetical protein